MALERILVTLQGAPQDAELTRAGAALAPLYEARVEGVYVEPDPSSYLMWTAPGAAAAAVMASAVDSIREESEQYAAAAQSAFDGAFEGDAVERDFIRISDLPADAAMEARLARLMVACPKAAAGRGGLADFVLSAMTDEAIPVYVPRVGALPPKRIALAWDGSREAARAVFAADPLIREAEEVVVVQSERGLDYTDRQAARGDHLDEWLKARDCAVRYQAIDPKGDIGAALLSSAGGCDLIVAGAFGHSRLREFVFGGVTRTLMHATDGPSLLLAH